MSNTEKEKVGLKLRMQARKALRDAERAAEEKAIADKVEELKAEAKSNG